jgi:hypothetical protein
VDAADQLDDAGLLQPVAHGRLDAGEHEADPVGLERPDQLVEASGAGTAGG